MVSLASPVLLILLAPVCHNFAVQDQVGIECDDSPVTGNVNVTYFGEADVMYPMNGTAVLDSCDGEFRPDGTYVLLDVSHGNCAFFRLNNTNTFTIRVRIQKRRELMTVLDKEFSLSCVYDDHKEIQSL